MSKYKWRILHNEKESEPMDQEKILDMITKDMISQDALLIKDSWKEWKSLKDCKTYFVKEGKLQEKRINPRVSIPGRVIIYKKNGEKILFGTGINISASGLFIETKKDELNIGDEIKVVCKIDHYIPAFNTLAKVVRHNKNPNHHIGYGLEFKEINSFIQEKIKEVVAKALEWDK